MTYPLPALIADFTYPPSGDPGYTSLDHTAITDGSAREDMFQTIVPTDSGSLFVGWQTVWFKDITTPVRFPGGPFTDANGYEATGCITHFRVPPGPDIFLPELYGKMTNRADIVDIRHRLVRVYPTSKADNPTAEKRCTIGGNHRWAGGEASMTYPKAQPKATPRSLREPEYIIRLEFRVQVAPGETATFILDNRYPKWLNPNELVGQRTLVG